MRDFDQIYREFAPSVYRVSLKYVGRPEIAEEITSEVFLALYQSLDSLDASALPQWLFTVAKRRAVDYWRRYSRELPLDENIHDTEVLPSADDRELVLQLCGNMKPVHRMCVLLRYFYGLSRTEIAEAVGLDEMQVKGNLQYALKLLKSALGERRKGLNDAKAT